MAKLVSKVYGDALFSLAVEENRVDELWDETRAMKRCFRKIRISWRFWNILK